MDSILQNEKICFVCDMEGDLHRHHVFHGTANRKKSEEYGCWVWLCPRHHNMSSEGVHFNPGLDLRIKQMAQEAWEERYGNRGEFIKAFGKSYL